MKPRRDRSSSRVTDLSCPRCGGFMSAERFSDLGDGSGEYHFRGYRCLTCGEVLDPVILANRRQPAQIGRKVAASARK